MVVTEVNNKKDWLKPDHSKKKKWPDTVSKALYAITTSIRVNYHDTSRKDHIRNKTPPTTRRQSQNLAPQSSEITYPWKHIKFQELTYPLPNSLVNCHGPLSLLLLSQKRVSTWIKLTFILILTHSWNLFLGAWRLLHTGYVPVHAGAGLGPSMELVWWHKDIQGQFPQQAQDSWGHSLFITSFMVGCDLYWGCISVQPLPLINSAFFSLSPLSLIPRALLANLNFRFCFLKLC